MGILRPTPHRARVSRGGVGAGGQIRSIDVVNGGDKEARDARNAAVHTCAGAALHSAGGSRSGAVPAAAPILRRAGSSRRRARLRRRRWPRRRRPGRPVRPSSSAAGEALRLIHAVRAVAEAAARPRQARVPSRVVYLCCKRSERCSLLLIVIRVCFSTMVCAGRSGRARPPTRGVYPRTRWDLPAPSPPRCSSRNRPPGTRPSP